MKNFQMEEMVWRVGFQILKHVIAIFPNISQITIPFYDSETYNPQIIDLNLHKRIFFIYIGWL